MMRGRHANKIVVVVAVVAMLALALATFAVIQWTSEQHQRERDRIAADLAGCERGNVLRAQIRGIGLATEDLFDRGVRDPIAGTLSEAAPGLARYVELLDRLLANYHSQIVAVEQIDCGRVTPGGGP